MKFSPEFFQKITVTPEQVDKHFQNAEKDLRMTSKINEHEVVFMLCYNAIIKLGIAIIAEKGYKVRSIPGHHYKILQTIGKITGLDDEIKYVQRVRNKRNVDLYEGGAIISKKEADNLLKITKTIFKSVN